jgi:kynurenine formamidase
MYFDDLVDNFYLQGSSQWDALGHAGYDVNAFYNGATEQDILAGRRNTIEHWSSRGIAGRAVLLDMVRTYAEDGRPYDPGTSVAFEVEDLERARSLAGVELKTGDILLVYTGVDEWYRTMSEEDRYALFPAKGPVSMAGIAHSEAVCRYLWDHHIAVIASDTVAVEVCPSDPSHIYGSLHRILIGQFGMMLGELLWLRDLAADCAEDGVYEMFFTASPIHVVGGIGSTTNAMAIK